MPHSDLAPDTFTPKTFTPKSSAPGEIAIRAAALQAGHRLIHSSANSHSSRSRVKAVLKDGAYIMADLIHCDAASQTETLMTWCLPSSQMVTIESLA